MKDFGLIVGSAVRYALPRHTYITSVTADFVRQHWGDLDQQAQHVIRNDLCEALAEPGSRHMMEVDRVIWQELHDWITAQMAEREVPV